MAYDTAEWTVASLGELGEFRNGVNFSKDDYGDGLPIVNVKQLYSGRYADVQGLLEVKPSAISNVDAVLLQYGDILFARSSVKASGAGQVAMVGPCPLNAVFSGFIIRFRVKATDRAVPEFLNYLLRSPSYRELLTRIGSGTTITNLSQSTLAGLQVRLPPVNEQQAIACILGALDDKIELNRRMNQTLEGMARAIFKSWFVDFDPVRAKLVLSSGEGAAGRQSPGLAPHIADLFPDGFEASELGEIPKGWTRTSLKRLFPLDSNCVITGPFGSNLHASDYREEGVPLLLVKNVVNGAIVEDGVPLVGWHKVPELERYRLKLGDIIFTRVGAVGRSAYIHPRYVGWMISGQTLRVSISDWNTLHPRYLASVFQYPAFIAMVESHALGTTRPSLNTNILESFEFLYSSPELQLEYARIVAALDERRLANLDQIGTLATLRDTLLPKLISGELRVPDAERIVGRCI